VLLASIIVQLAESTVYSLHWHLSDILSNYCTRNGYIDTAMASLEFSLVV